MCHPYKTFISGSILLMLCCTSAQLCAQDLKVTYDFINKKVELYQDVKGEYKPVNKSLIIKKGLINLEVRNMNPFALNLDVDARDSTEPQANLAMLLDLKSMSSELLYMNDFGRTRGAGTHENPNAQLDSLENRINFYKDELIKKSKEIEKLEQLNGKLQKLKGNITMTGDSLKDSAQSLIRGTFAATELNDNVFANYAAKHYPDYTLTYILYKVNVDAYVSLFSYYMKDTTGQNEESQADRLEAFALEKMNGTDTVDLTTLIKWKEHAIHVEEEMQRLSEYGENHSKEKMQSLYTSISDNYNAIVKSVFTQKVTLRVANDADMKIINLSFYYKEPTADGRKGLNYADQVVIHYAKKVKFAVSTGFMFSSMFAGAREYSNHNGVVTMDKGNNFIPSFATMATMAFTSQLPVTGGLSFGVGIPLISPVSASFYFGPSLLVGKKQEMIFTAGIMGGQVTKLTNGYTVGEVLLSYDSAVPTHNVYDLGFFVGISYNLLSSIGK